MPERLDVPEFAGRVAMIATMHRKEQVIAPLLSAALGVQIQVPENFNTDAFGTFTRDVKRPADQLTTARLKAAAALDLTGETLAIASEGSFGPHPEIPLIPADRELVLLLDRQHQLEIVGQAISTETNYRAQTVRTLEEAAAFAERVGFPECGLVVLAGANDPPSDVIAKGLTDTESFQAAVREGLQAAPSGRVQLETDMRALYNPLRLQAIAAATEDLIRAIAHRCPNCGCPGFRAVQRRPGLPCGLCQTPTLLTLALLYRCQRCQFEQTEKFPDGRQFADPAQCPYCNP